MFERVNDAAGTAATLHALRHTAAYRMAGLGCRPIRDLLVSYLHERQPSLDYNSLKDLSYYLARRFWKDLEVHHPGIDSLRLTPEVAAGWRERLLKKQPSRSGAETGEDFVPEPPRPGHHRGLSHGHGHPIRHSASTMSRSRALLCATISWAVGDFCSFIPDTHDCGNWSFIPINTIVAAEETTFLRKTDKCSVERSFERIRGVDM